MSSAPVKRFIAGAVCPACSAADKLRMWSDAEGARHRECVACGYGDTLDERGNAIPRELPTRVNQRPAGQAQPQQVKVAQFFPNPKLKKPH